MEHLISVIIPVYKVEQYLHRCVDSVLQQTYQNLEIILVDDGSPDTCGAICDQYTLQDARIKVIHKANAGLGEARNSGMEIATGDYFFFLDSDDFIPLDAIACLYERILQDNSDMAVGRFTLYYDDGSTDDSGTRWMKNAVYTGEQIIEQMKEDQQLVPSAWGKLYKKELFQEIRYPKVACGEDLWVFPMLAAKCGLISVSDRIVCYYYQRATSIMNVYNERAQIDNLKTHLHVTRFLLQYGAFASALKWHAITLLRAFMVRDAKAARKLYCQSLDAKTNRKLLRQQSKGTILLWVSMFVPSLKKGIQWRWDRKNI